MALPLPPGLTPPETAFLCEMEFVTVVPRQRLEGLPLLGGPIPLLNPPSRTNIPLWLALLLKKQRRANILAPAWLSQTALSQILDVEKTSPSFSTPPEAASSTAASSPFLPSAVASAPADALPYHWLELGTLLLESASDDIPDSDMVRRLIRDLREVRMAKLRAGVSVLEGGREVGMKGVGGMEVAEGRAFIGGVVDGLRKIGASKEIGRKEREAEEREGDLGRGDEDGDDDEL